MADTGKEPFTALLRSLKRTPVRASVVIITNGPMTHGIFQRKDGKHPIKAARGKLALFGGEARIAESARRAMAREITEEISDKELRAEIIAKAVPMHTFEKLPFGHISGTYTLDVFVARLSTHGFGEATRRILAPSCVREGVAEPFLLNTISVMLEEPELFFASQDVAIRHFLASR